MNKWTEFTPEQSVGFGTIKNIVCAYCRNQLRYGCIEVCAPEGLYRNLEPVDLGTWQRPPKLLSMATLMEYAPVTRVAFILLTLHYLQKVEE